MNNNIRSELMSGLANIRLSLCIKKMTAPTIKRNDFRKLIDNVKLKIFNFTVAAKIDEVFSEYFKNDNIKNHEKIEENSNVFSLDKMRTMIDSGNSADGTQLKKSLPAFRTPPVDKNEAA